MAGVEPIIRKAEAADLEALRDLLIETWHATYDPIYGAARVDEITGRWHSVEALALSLARPATIDLVSVEGGFLIGTACCAWAADAANLHRLYVRPAAQGRGVGSRLLAAVIGELRRQPAVTSLKLEVEPKNAGAIGFYRRHGFTEAGRTADCGRSGDAIPALVMTRALTIM